MLTGCLAHKILLRRFDIPTPFYFPLQYTPPTSFILNLISMAFKIIVLYSVVPIDNHRSLWTNQSGYGGKVQEGSDRTGSRPANTSVSAQAKHYTCHCSEPWSRQFDILGIVIHTISYYNTGKQRCFAVWLELNHVGPM